MPTDRASSLQALQKLPSFTSGATEPLVEGIGHEPEALVVGRLQPRAEVFLERGGSIGQANGVNHSSTSAYYVVVHEQLGARPLAVVMLHCFGLTQLCLHKRDCSLQLV